MAPAGTRSNRSLHSTLSATVLIRVSADSRPTMGKLSRNRCPTTLDDRDGRLEATRAVQICGAAPAALNDAYLAMARRARIGEMGFAHRRSYCAAANGQRRPIQLQCVWRLNLGVRQRENTCLKRT